MVLTTTTTTSRFLFENDVGTHDKLAQTRVVDTAAMVDGVTSGGSLGEDPRAFVDGRVFGVAVRKTQHGTDARRDGSTDDDFLVVLAGVVDGIKRRLATSKRIG